MVVYPSVRGFVGDVNDRSLMGVSSFHGSVVQLDVGSMIVRQGVSSVGCLTVMGGYEVAPTIYQGGYR
jgi:hypothetical protein